MRHTYVGDQGDYAKLALLRAVQDEFSLGVNWYLTVHDEKPGAGGGDGRKLSHLTDDDWRYLDAALLDRMRLSLDRWLRGDRHIAHLEKLLPGAVFFGEELPTGRVPLGERVAAREAWHRQALDVLADVDVVFVDPDNGFEVRSRGPRAKWRCKYATYGEVADYLARGQAVVAYQHQPRTTWADVVAGVRDQLRAREVPTAPPGFVSFGSRGFFLMHRDPDSVRRLTAIARRVAERSPVPGSPRLTPTVIPPA